MGMFKEFKEFALRGNVVDMAVGVVIGAAFGKIVNSLVDNVMMPPIGRLVGNVDFSQLSWKLGETTKTVVEGGVERVVTNEVVLRWGAFVNSVVDFAIVAVCLFAVVKGMNTLKRTLENPPAPKEPASPPPDVQLLTEIRDLLKERGA